MSQQELDARRILCPLPVIRTQDAIKDLSPGDVLVVTATDPESGDVHWTQRLFSPQRHPAAAPPRLQSPSATQAS